MKGRRSALGALASAAIVLGVSVTGISPHAAAPDPLVFGPVVVLGPDVGGEPSIQDDSRGHVYVTSPTGLASAAVNDSGVLTVNSATGGGALWRSVDGGKTFVNPGAPIFFGTQNGGGDTDVTADKTGVVYTADLEAAAADVQISKDYGATFSNALLGQTGPDDDREWLTPVGNKLFLTYHDFSVNVDLIYVSTDGGVTFTPTGLGGKIIDPTDNPTAAADCFNGNLISKPVTDREGALYILINCSTAPSNITPTGAPLNRLYIAISRDGGASFKTTLASDVGNGGTNGGTWGHVFNQLGIDDGGDLFIVASGNLHGTDPVQTFLIRSLDNGRTWKAPINLNADTPTNASVFPAVATGQAGEVAAGYYRVVGCQQGSLTCKQNDYRSDGTIFQFFITQSLNARQAVPDFTTTQVTTTSPHQNGICTDGIFCGLPGLSAGGNRNLADFESMTVDPTGHIELVIPADPLNVLTTDFHPTVNWYFKQTGGALMVPGTTNGNGTGNQTYPVGSLVTPTATPVTAASANPQILPPTSTAGSPGVVFAGVGLAAVFAGGVAIMVEGTRRKRRRQGRET